MNNKLHFVEGLRGFAAMTVVLQHFALMFYPCLYSGDTKVSHFSGSFEHVLATTPLNILYNGNFAVCLFFVLSGFVLSHRYYRTGDRNVLLEYGMKRYFRLLLPVAASVLLCIGMIAFFKPNLEVLEDITFSGPWLRGLFADAPDAWDVARNILFDVFWDGNNKYNMVLWTMGVEFIGSLLIFGILFIGHVSGYRLAVPVLALIVSLFMQKYFYAAFFAGAIICERFVAKNGIRLPVWFTLILLVSGLYLGSYPTSWQFYEVSVYAPLQKLPVNIMDLSLVSGAVALFLFVCSGDRIRKFFSSGPLLFLGKISFSNYLIHLVLMTCVSARLFLLMTQYLSYNWSFVFTFLISIPLFFLSSLIFQRLFDLPAIKLSNRIGKMLLDKIR